MVVEEGGHRVHADPVAAKRVVIAARKPTASKAK
jgi:hypothetical protein